MGVPSTLSFARQRGGSCCVQLSEEELGELESWGDLYAFEPSDTCMYSE